MSKVKKKQDTLENVSERLFGQEVKDIEIEIENLSFLDLNVNNIKVGRKAVVIIAITVCIITTVLALINTLV